MLGVAVALLGSAVPQLEAAVDDAVVEGLHGPEVVDQLVLDVLDLHLAEYHLLLRAGAALVKPRLLVHGLQRAVVGLAGVLLVQLGRVLLRVVLLLRQLAPEARLLPGRQGQLVQHAQCAPLASPHASADGPPAVVVDGAPVPAVVAAVAVAHLQHLAEQAHLSGQGKRERETEMRFNGMSGQVKGGGRGGGGVIACEGR